MLHLGTLRVSIKWLRINGMDASGVPIQAAKNRGGVDLDLDLHPQLLPNRVLPSVASELKLGTLGGLAARKQSNKE